MPIPFQSTQEGAVGVLTTSLLQRWWNTNHFPRRLAFFDDVLRVFLHKLKGLEPLGLGYLIRHRTIILTLPIDMEGGFGNERLSAPLEAILVIFGRRALIFFCLKALGKNEK